MRTGHLAGRSLRGGLLTALFLLGVGGERQAYAEDDCVVVEDFATAAVGQFPPGWQPRRDEGRKVYTVAEEGGRKFLRAVARNVGIQAAREVPWDLDSHPVLAWAWRPRQFPQRAHEKSGKNDSVLAVYAVFPYSQLAVKSVKYIWSEAVPVDTRLTSSKGLTQVRVVRSGVTGQNEWSEMRANAREDYRRYFGEREVPRPAGIAVLTDSDDTHSVAAGDYANFRVCRG